MNLGGNSILHSVVLDCEINAINFFSVEKVHAKNSAASVQALSAVLMRIVIHNKHFDERLVKLVSEAVGNGVVSSADSSVLFMGCLPIIAVGTN